MCFCDPWASALPFPQDLDLLTPFISACQLDGLWFENLLVEADNDLMNRIGRAINSNTSLQGLAFDELPDENAVLSLTYLVQVSLNQESVFLRTPRV